MIQNHPHCSEWRETKTQFGHGFGSIWRKFLSLDRERRMTLQSSKMRAELSALPWLGWRYHRRFGLWER